MKQENEKKIKTPEVKNEQVNPTPPAQEQPVANTSTPAAEAAPSGSETNANPAPATTPVENHQPKIQEEVIYNIKEDKGGNIFGVIFFFAIIFAALYFLPTISSTLGKYIPWIKTIRINQPAPTVEKKPEEKEEKENKEKLYDLNGFVSDAGIDNLQLGNFVKDNNTGENKLSFYILNNGDEPFIFNDNTKFFIDLYDDEKYVSSALVYSYKDIGPKESIDFSVIISANSYNKANKFKIVRKNKNEYKAINITKQEGEYKKLTCTYGNNTIEYFFIDKYLEVINDNFTENRSNLNYAQDIEKYRNEGQRFNDIKGIDYNVIESNEGFNVKTRVELQNINDVDLKKLAIYKYFSYHKENKVVSFEMTSLGYDCN